MVKCVRVGSLGALQIDEPLWSDHPEAHGAGTGAVLWEGSVLLAETLLDIASTSSFPATTENEFSEQLQRPPVLHGRCLELGAGCAGVPSIVAAQIGCFSEVTATDSDKGDSAASNLPDLQRNINANSSKLASKTLPAVRKLEFGDGSASERFSAPLDVLLGSDIVYDPSVIPLLLQTLSDLAGPRTDVLLYISSVRCREACDLFWDGVSEGWVWRRLAAGPSGDEKDGVFLFRQK